MTPEIAKRLLDARHACMILERILNDTSIDSFLDDVVLELAVQKLLENIGEALNQIRRADSNFSAVIPDMHRYIGLRNHLSHGYDSVNYDILWTIANQEVPDLARAIDDLLRDAPDPNEESATKE